MSATDILEGGKGGMDKNGFLSRTLNFKVDTEEEALTVGPATFLGVPQKKGGRTWSPWKAGKFAVEVEYEGLINEGEENFEIVKTRSTEPIESHPYIAFLKKKYYGTEDSETGKITFPSFVTASQVAAQTQVGLSSPPSTPTAPASTSEIKFKNPMGGRETYWRFGLMVRWSYGTKTFPRNWLDKDNTVMKTIPGPMPKVADHDWLCLVQGVRSRGSGDALGWEVSVDFLLSEKGGWPPMYTVIQQDF